MPTATETAPAVPIPKSATRLQKIERQRYARASKSARKLARLEREREVVIRLSARALRHGYAFTLLQLDYRYWQCRSCGWDVATKAFAVNATGDACDPAASSTWLWWVGLHWKSRERIRADSLFSRNHRH